MSRIRKENIFLADYLKAIRIYHWPKNLLVFLPALTGHLLTPESFSTLLVVFFSLSFAASGNYLINDLLDIDNDKKHPTKKNRLIASGSLKPKNAKIISLLLIIMGLLGSFAVSFYAGILIFAYIVLVNIYSLYIKRVPFFEAFFLTLVYLLRIYIGLLVINESASQWLMIFSFFFFFFLVLVKRHAELLLHLKSLEDDPTGRRYQINDINLIQSFSVSSGLLSLLVFGLYIASPKVQALYTSPNYLWLVASLGLLWIIDVLVLVHKGEIHYDPMVHAIKNKRSLGILSAGIIFVVLSL
jgi:4-hydroxybenzoate polyprenyltransferase